MSLDEFVYAMNESRFKPLEGSSNDIFKVAEQRLYGKMDKKGNQLQNSNNGTGNASNANGNGNAAVDPNVAGNQTAANNNGNNPSGNQQEKNNNQEKNKPLSPKLRKKPSPADGLLAALNLDPGSDHKLKRLHDILKPYMVEGGADVSIRSTTYLILHTNHFVHYYRLNTSMKWKPYEENKRDMLAFSTEMFKIYFPPWILFKKLRMQRLLITLLIIRLYSMKSIIYALR